MIAWSDCTLHSMSVHNEYKEKMRGSIRKAGPDDARLSYCEDATANGGILADVATDNVYKETPMNGMFRKTRDAWR